MNKKVLNIFFAILITSVSVIGVYAWYLQWNFFDSSWNSVRYVCYDTPWTWWYYSCAVLIPSTNNTTTWNSCNLSDWTTLANWSSKNLYYKNSSWNSCIYASYKCNNWTLARGTQFSPAPSQPVAWSTLYTTSSACTSSINSSWNTWCSWTLPSWAWVVSCNWGCVDFSPVNTVWTYSSNPTTACTWWCASWYTRNWNSCVVNSNSTTVSWTCTWLPSNAVYYNNSTSYSISNAPTWTSLSASYQSNPTSNTCKYKCNSSSTRNWSSCVVNTWWNTWTSWWKWVKVPSEWVYFSPMPPQCSSQSIEWWNCNEWWYCIWNWFDLKCQYSWAQSWLIKIETNWWKSTISNCSDPWSTLNFTVWNSTQDIKACMEYNLTAQWRVWQTYNCDSDSKFQNLASPWRFETNKWSYFTYLQNHKTFVPWKYRLVVKANDWTKIYWDWLTINTSWSLSNPANCNYYAYPAQSVEDAVDYILRTKDVHISTWIDYTNIKNKCPDIQIKMIQSAWDAANVFWINFKDPSIGWWWQANYAVLWDLSRCFTRTIPNPPKTYSDWYGNSNLPWEINNPAIFDFQSWYNWWSAWAAPWCWNWWRWSKSQIYWWQSWQAWKTVVCPGWWYGNWWGTTTWTNCTLSDWTTLNNWSSKNLYYKNSSWNSCIYASYRCNSWTLVRGTQFSPAPQQPTAWSILYTTSSACSSSLTSSSAINVSFSKTKLNVTNDSLNITVNWLTYDNFQWCRAVLVHPTVPSAVNANKCNNVNEFTTIKDAWTDWFYSNWVWKNTIISDSANMPSWTKLRSHFRNKDTWEIKSVEWEIIWTNTSWWASWCSWTLPTWVWVVSCNSSCVDFSPQNYTWTYSTNPTTSCTWWCKSWYTRSWNSCIINSTSTVPNLPTCWTNWKTIWIFTCDSQNRQVQTINTCLPNWYSDPMLWNWNKTTNSFSHLTWNLCNWVSNNWYPWTSSTTTTSSSSLVWVSTLSFWAPPWREDLLCERLWYNPTKLEGTSCRSEWFICYQSMWYWNEYKCTKK